MEELLLGIAKLSPVIALLIASIFYFLKREKKFEAQIEELHKELRDSDKENVSLLIKVSATLDKLVNK